MKYNQLKNKLEQAGCYILRHGKKHDIWINPVNRHKMPVPRHGSKEIKYGTLIEILRELLGE